MFGSIRAASPNCSQRWRRSRAGIAVPRLRDAAGVLIPSMRREPTILRALGDLVLGANRAGRYGTIGEVVTDVRRYDAETVTDWAEGSTLLLDAECLRRCGEWDESFFLYSEETELALRARDAGWLVRYVPTAEAVHLEGGSAHAPRLWTLLTLNRLRLYRKRHGALATAAYWSVLFLRELSRGALGKPTSRMAARALLSRARIRELPGPATVHSSR